MKAAEKRLGNVEDKIFNDFTCQRHSGMEERITGNAQWCKSLDEAVKDIASKFSKLFIGLAASTVALVIALIIHAMIMKE